MKEALQEMLRGEQVPTSGLLTINHAYNQGKLTFAEWMDLSRKWSLAMVAQFGNEKDKQRWGVTSEDGAA